LVTRLWAGFGLTTWMQTAGTTLLLYGRGPEPAYRRLTAVVRRSGCGCQQVLMAVGPATWD